MAFLEIGAFGRHQNAEQPDISLKVQFRLNNKSLKNIKPQGLEKEN
jgi:hypothetical protein